MNEKFKWLYTHVAWFLAAIIVLIDPKHIYEWAHQHEVWGGVIAAVFTALLAWAHKNRPQGPGPLTPPNSPPQGRVLHCIAFVFVLLLPFAAAIATTSCAVTLGAHVKHFRVRGVEFTKCTVIGERDQPQINHESLEVCKEAFEHPGQVQK